MNRLKYILDTIAMRAAIQFPRLNDGGCGVFALAVAEHLHGKVNFKIKASDDTPGCLDTAREKMIKRGSSDTSLYAWGDNYIWFGHIFLEIEIDGMHYRYDSSGISLADGTDPSFGWECHAGELTMWELKEMVRQPEGWNEAFKRRDIPKVRELVNNGFKNAPSDLFVN